MSVLLLSVVDTVLSGKHKAEELSKIKAKKRRRENKSKVRTPNTQRASCGIDVPTKLKEFDAEKQQESNAEDVKRLIKSIDECTKLLTGWRGLVEKQNRVAAERNVDVGHHLLWPLPMEKAFAKSER